MDILVNKSRKYYDYTSRYSVIPYYYNPIDKKYIYGISKNLKNDTEYVLHTVTDTDTLDSLALKYYGSPDLFWVIADYNRIHDSYINLYEKYNYIFIPSLAGIRYEN